MAGMDHPTSEQLEELRVRFGLDQPLLIQLKQYVFNLLRGDMGTSYTYNKPVASLILETMGPSMLLAFTSCVLSFVIGTLLGLFAARHQGRWMDTSLSYVLICSTRCRRSGWALFPSSCLRPRCTGCRRRA